MLTGLKDTDRELLKHVEDQKLLRVCSINKKMWYEVCDDNFIRRRLEKFKEVEKYKKGNESWKKFFVKAIHYISVLNNKFDFEYKGGDFECQNDLLTKFVKHDLLFQAVRKNELYVVKYAVEKGASVRGYDDYCLRWAANHGNFEIVKYLVQQGANVHVCNESSLIAASFYGHIEIVRFLILSGAIVNSESLLYAAKKGHLEVLQFLLQNFQCTLSLKSELLRRANNGKYREMVKYLNKID